MRKKLTDKLNDAMYSQVKEIMITDANKPGKFILSLLLFYVCFLINKIKHILMRFSKNVRVGTP